MGLVNFLSRHPFGDIAKILKTENMFVDAQVNAIK